LQLAKIMVNFSINGIFSKFEANIALETSSCTSQRVVVPSNNSIFLIGISQFKSYGVLKISALLQVGSQPLSM
jgi:hypothetical protein